MKLLDLTLPTPEENLACDEALLESLESESGGEVLRFWESPTHFIVLGSSNKVHEEVHVEACRADNIPILRRHSGGGTVLQGPGCLNYSLILRIDSQGDTQTLTSTNRHILTRNAEVFSNLLNQAVEMKGSSDLAIEGRKISGNAQRRRLNALLFHGTFLLDVDLSLMEKYLTLPPKQPAYRAQRPHQDFVRNVRIDSFLLKNALQEQWGATDGLAAISREKIAALVREKYSLTEWNFKL